MAVIPDAYLDLLTQKKAFAELATVMPDGSPQVTPVWFDYTNGNIRVNTAKGRVKQRNMKEGSPVALSIMDPDNRVPVRPGARQGHAHDRGRRQRAYRLTGKEVSRQGQVSARTARRGAGDLRDHACRRAGDGLKRPRTIVFNRHPREEPPPAKAGAGTQAGNTVLRPLGSRLRGNDDCRQAPGITSPHRRRSPDPSRTPPRPRPDTRSSTPPRRDCRSGRPGYPWRVP